MVRSCNAMIQVTSATRVVGQDKADRMPLPCGDVIDKQPQKALHASGGTCTTGQDMIDRVLKIMVPLAVDGSPHHVRGSLAGMS